MRKKMAHLWLLLCEAIAELIENDCNQNCNQGDNCTCRVQRPQ